MRLVFVTGMPGGGTSAATGMLTKNGFWNRSDDNTFFEDRKAAILYTTSIWFKPKHKPTKEQINVARKYFDEYKAEAAFYGYDKAVVKIAWHMLWEPEILAENDVEVLLVSRDVKGNAKSIINKWGPDPGRGVSGWTLAEEGQDRILELSELYNWPVWNFCKHPDISALEDIVGVELPNTWFQPSRVRNE